MADYRSDLKSLFVFLQRTLVIMKTKLIFAL